MKKLLVILIVLSPLTFVAATANQDSIVNLGKDLFRINCRACHTIDKNLVGPALSKVYERRDSIWVKNFIKGSQRMISEGDPIAIELFQKYNQVPMPDQALDDEQIDLILAYIKSEDNAIPTLSSNPISRPHVEKISYSRHFRFSNYLFWIPFTLTVILGIVVLNALTIHHDIIEENRKKTT